MNVPTPTRQPSGQPPAPFSQRPQRLQRTLQFAIKHGELMATIVCGLLIISAYVFPSAAIPLFISAFVIGGFAKAKEGIEDVITSRTFNVEILMILAAIGAGIIGHWAEGAILIFIFSLSGALETYTMNKSERDLSKLMHLQPDKATKIIGNEHHVISVSALAVGDRVLVKPGERFPIDGKIVSGSSTVDESPITGESVPIEKQKDDLVYAGTYNRSGSIVLDVTKKTADTLFQKIVRLVQEAQQDEAPSQQFIERFEKTYVKVVLVVVALMFFVPHYAFGWSWEETWYRALVLLVVASPCALVASISPAMLSVLSYGARNGVLVKGGSHLEQMAQIGAVGMDKTGTITNGTPHVTDVFVRPGIDQTAFLQTVAGLERHSAHPLAKAIVQYVDKQSLSHLDLEGITNVSGKGIYGTIDGNTWAIGSARFVGKEDANEFLQYMLTENRTAKDQATDHALDGKTIVFARDADGIAGAVIVQDTVRPEAREAIHSLRAQGIDVVMITGDQQAVAESIAKEVDISSVHAGTLPDEKMQLIDELRKKHGTVMMIGDGINDAPALAKSDIGVAMGGGTDIALDTADLVLIKNNLRKIADTVRVSKKMNRIIKQNIVFSLSVIFVLIMANFFQVLTLPYGVLGHEGSTILVILNGLRLLRG